MSIKAIKSFFLVYDHVVSQGLIITSSWSYSCLSSFIYCFRPVSMEGYPHSITAYFILEVKELYGLIII